MSAVKNQPGTDENELIQLLLKRQAELNSLLEVTRAINRNSSSSVLFQMLEVIFKVHLKIGKMRLLVKEEEHFYCASKYGGKPEDIKTLQQICQVLQASKTTEKLSEHPHPALNSYQYFVPVRHKKAMLAFVLIGDFESEAELISNDLNFVQTLINLIIVALENKKLFKDRVQRERLQRDMELASEVQSMMIPGNLPYSDEIQVASMYLPNQNIGGDYFDFIKINEEEYLWCIADVSGKGVSAALLMANLQASLRAWTWVETDLRKIVDRLNHVLIQNTKGERFITMFIAKYNLKTRQLRYINAGHNPPLLVTGRSVQFLTLGTTMIGAFDELPHMTLGVVQVPPDSVIFNYTDGLLECSNENVYITDDELAEHLVQYSNYPVNELNKQVIEAIRQKHNVRMDDDDVTLLTIKIL
ncbi:PP2C family protein-serine/threonine phosphatase [Pedobacter sp. BS3]|nr:PP2C family protein-serine/threonine phosphatase [Pedobacter sp. BS3]